MFKKIIRIGLLIALLAIPLNSVFAQIEEGATYSCVEIWQGGQIVSDSCSEVDFLQWDFCNVGGGYEGTSGPDGYIDGTYTYLATCGNWVETPDFPDDIPVPDDVVVFGPGPMEPQPQVFSKELPREVRSWMKSAREGESTVNWAGTWVMYGNNYVIRSEKGGKQELWLNGQRIGFSDPAVESGKWQGVAPGQ